MPELRRSRQLLQEDIYMMFSLNKIFQVTFVNGGWFWWRKVQPLSFKNLNIPRFKYPFKILTISPASWCPVPLLTGLPFRYCILRAETIFDSVLRGLTSKSRRAVHASGKWNISGCSLAVRPHRPVCLFCFFKTPNSQSPGLQPETNRSQVTFILWDTDETPRSVFDVTC